MWRKVELVGEASHVKKEKRESGERERGFRVMRFMMCWGFKEGRRCLRDAWKGFDGEFWMA